MHAHSFVFYRLRLCHHVPCGNHLCVEPCITEVYSIQHFQEVSACLSIYLRRYCGSVVLPASLLLDVPSPSISCAVILVHCGDTFRDLLRHAEFSLSFPLSPSSCPFAPLPAPPPTALPPNTALMVSMLAIDTTFVQPLYTLAASLCRSRRVCDLQYVGFADKESLCKLCY